MLAAIEKLLILQDRDHKMAQLAAELDSVAPQRTGAQARTAGAQSSLDAAKHRAQQVEAERKRLEIEVDSRKQLIEKYSLQQFQTKRNEEYKALTHEIENCKADIAKLEDRQLELMEEAESLHKTVVAARHQLEETQRESDRMLADLTAREQELRRRHDELGAGRAALAAAVDASVLARYERLRRSKGGRVVVGVEHGACGGCHVGLPAQVVIACRAEQEITQCPNCSRILFYTRDMDMVRAE